MKKMRTYDIIDYVKTKKRASLNELMEKFGVSSATIHRDVAELVASGHLERIRGGVAFFARAANPASANGGISYLDRATVNLSAKKRIAEKAVELVADGDILFLDSSTTTAAFAEELSNRSFVNLTIVTNSISIALEASGNPNYNVILAGGAVNTRYQFTHGSDAVAQLKQYHADKLILSVDGISTAQGFTTYYNTEAPVDVAMIEQSDSCIVAADRSKFGHSALAKISDLSVADYIVTNERPSQELCEALAEKGVSVLF